MELKEIVDKMQENLAVGLSHAKFELAMKYNRTEDPKFLSAIEEIELFQTNTLPRFQSDLDDLDQVLNNA